jgi:hypothetical protein
MENPDLSSLTKYHFLHYLSPRHQQIISLRYGLEGHPHTLEEIGVILGEPVTTIRREEEAAWKELRKLPTSGILMGGDEKVRPFEPTTQAEEYEQTETLARLIADNAVRRAGLLETYHGDGIFPRGRRADNSDVQVVTPDEAIPWNKVARISDKEMRALMLQIEKQLGVYLRFINDHRRRGTLGALVADQKWEYEQYGVTWDRPKEEWEKWQATDQMIRKRKKTDTRPKSSSSSD